MEADPCTQMDLDDNASCRPIQRHSESRVARVSLSRNSGISVPIASRSGTKKASNLKQRDPRAPMQGHRRITVPMVEKAISQLGDRQGSTVSRIRTVLATSGQELARPAACCVKKALLRGVKTDRLKQAPDSRGRFQLQLEDSTSRGSKVPLSNVKSSSLNKGSIQGRQPRTRDDQQAKPKRKSKSRRRRRMGGKKNGKRGYRKRSKRGRKGSRKSQKKSRGKRRTKRSSRSGVKRPKSKISEPKRQQSRQQSRQNSRQQSKQLSPQNSRQNSSQQSRKCSEKNGKKCRQGSLHNSRQHATKRNQKTSRQGSIQRSNSEKRSGWSSQRSQSKSQS